MKIYSRKIPLVEAINNSKNPPNLVIDFLNIGGVHEYTYFNTHEELFKNISKFEYDGKYYIFEMLLGSIKRKPYLDIDKDYPDKKTCIKKINSLIPKIQQDIITVFKEQYGEEITIEDILLLDGSEKHLEDIK